jgi:hypothetical protein
MMSSPTPCQAKTTTEVKVKSTVLHAGLKASRRLYFWFGACGTNNDSLHVSTDDLGPPCLLAHL